MEYPIYQGKDTFLMQFSFNDCLSLYFKVYINIFSPKFYLHLIKTKRRTWAQLLCWPDLCFLGVTGCIVWVYLNISFNNWQTQLIVRMRRGRGRNLFRHLFTIYRRPIKINVTQRNTHCTVKEYQRFIVMVLVRLLVSCRYNSEFSTITCTSKDFETFGYP